MNSYSKMKAFGTNKSRSVDFSELLPSFPAQTPKPVAEAGVEEARPEDSSCSEKEKDDYSDGERFGVILGRSSSISAASDRFRWMTRKAVWREWDLPRRRRTGESISLKPASDFWDSKAIYLYAMNVQLFF
ncbi:hypothetical protein NL676_016068 [Syzygium grande]|nr:hypothetical protein NL676_016068 [Syzygium grande]